MKNIMIIDDDVSIGNMLEEVLTREGCRVSRAYSGTEALLYLEANRPDLILLDLMLPGISGEELLGRFAGKTPVIVLSAKNELDSKVSLLSAGADDYICKPFELRELLVRIQVQLRRVSYSSEDSEITYREWKINPDTQEMTVSGTPVELTRHEFKILELMARHPKRVFTKQVIYEYAWEDECYIEDKTINVHISNIRSKLKESGTDQYIQTVWGMGFKLS